MEIEALGSGEDQDQGQDMIESITTTTVPNIGVGDRGGKSAMIVNIAAGTHVLGPIPTHDHDHLEQGSIQDGIGVENGSNLQNPHQEVVEHRTNLRYHWTVHNEDHLAPNLPPQTQILSRLLLALSQPPLSLSCALEVVGLTKQIPWVSNHAFLRLTTPP